MSLGPRETRSDDPTSATTRAITAATATPDPDPTLATLRVIQSEAHSHVVLVNTQLEVLKERIDGVGREAAARRDGIEAAIDQRLTAMDKANDLLAADLRKVPTDLQVAVVTLKELMGRDIQAVRSSADATSRATNDRFELLDKQTVREKQAADLALAAAFDAQKESAAATNASNAEAIRKSELGTAETIKTNAEAQRAGQQALSDKIDDLKDRLNQMSAAITAIQTARLTVQETRTDQRGGVGTSVAIASAIIALLAVVAAIVIAIVLR